MLLGITPQALGKRLSRKDSKDQIKEPE